MKKVLVIAIAMLLIPFTAFGLEVMTDADMDNVTGQTGVAISINDILIYTEGGNQIWYQNLEVWNTIDNEMKGPAAIGLVFGTDTSRFTYMNGLFWTENLHDYQGYGYGMNIGALTPVGSRGRFGLFGDYASVNWAAFGTGGLTTWKIGFETAAGWGANLALGQSSATLADVLTPRPFMISVQNNLFGDIQNFYDFGADGIPTVVIELGTLEIYRVGSEYFDIYLSEEEDPTLVQNNYESLGRIHRVDGGVTAYLSGDIAITARGLLYQAQY